MFDPNSPEGKAIREYFSDKKCLIIENSGAVRVTLRRLMVALGIDQNRQFTAECIPDAIEIILKEMPHYVLANYDIKNACAIELLPSHIEVYPNRLKAGFYVLSEKNSLSMASLVLDEEVDGFIGQPFTYAALEDSILQSINKKVAPTQYQKSIEMGKEMIFRNDMEQAQKFFAASKTIQAEHSLACFYEGFIHLSKKEKLAAEKSFDEGLAINAESYKCLRGQADLCYDLKKFDKSYECNARLAQNYPVNPSKIPDLTRISIITKKFEDITNYCKIFSSLEDKPGLIQKYISAGMAICGKFLFSTNHIEEGKKSLLKAAKLSDGKKEILRSIVGTLLKNDQKEAAQTVLVEYANDKTSGSDFKIMEMDILFESKEYKDAFTIATGLINEKVKDQRIFEVAIRCSLNLGRSQEKTEDIFFAATKMFPEKKDHFKKLMDP